MKKIIIIMLLLITVGCKAKSNIPEYDSDIICTKEFNETIDETKIDSKIIVYIYKNGELLDKVINQAIMDESVSGVDFNGLSDKYNEVNGIESKIIYDDSRVVWELTYDYNILSYQDIRKKLGNILDEDSIFIKRDTPVKVSDYIKYQLDGYKCEGV